MVRKSKNQLRREKAKLRKLDDSTKKDDSLSEDTKQSKVTCQFNHEEKTARKYEVQTDKSDKIDIAEDRTSNTALFYEYENVFNRFKPVQEEAKTNSEHKDEAFYNNEKNDSDSESSSKSDSDSSKNMMSKRSMRKRNQIPLSLLKSSTIHPQVVEWYDVNSRDPHILVALKSQPNTIQVPSHWSSKREYLASRKGIESLPFQLPKFIRDTGIQDMRNNDDQTLKQQQRGRVQPKMGKLDIDYQKLHDAFFKHQSKPRLFGYGDIYFEGRESMVEYEEEVAHITPGVVSKDLRTALGLPENNFGIAPPWITIMQELGKPPAYESLLIPGLDTEYDNNGYRAFGSQDTSQKIENYGSWGKLEVQSENSEDDYESEKDDEEIAYETDSDDGDKKDSDADKIEISEFGGHKVSLKESETTEDEKSNLPKTLYTVLQEDPSKAGNGLLKSEYGYVLNPGETKNANKVSEDNTNVENQSTKFKF